MPLKHSSPNRIILLDIDGLRHDIFQQALQSRSIPHIASLLGGPALEHGVQFNALSTAPSVTYCCQASTFTGAHPNQHWVPGNVYFDRFGRINAGEPRRYEFDFLDAPQVFLNGLAGQAIHPDIETIYMTAARHGLISTVAYNMYARGAQYWLKPGLDNWRAFFSFEKKGFSQRYDDAMVADVTRHLQAGHRPDLLTLYFFGLDHESHTEGAQVQFEYLTHIIDMQVGQLIDEFKKHQMMEGTLFVILSDHGQIDVIDDDAHMLNAGFLFDRELSKLFDAMGLDVHDHPLEGHNCDAVLAPGGGMAYVYLRQKNAPWHEPPSFYDEVLPLAQAFWQAHLDGSYCHDLQGALDMVAVRDAENEGWFARYKAYTPNGLVSIDEYLAANPKILMVDAANRLNNLGSPLTGDLVLFSNYEEGYSFSLLPYKGIHGGLHPADSEAVLAFGWPECSLEQGQSICQTLTQSIQERCQRENGRQPSNADAAYSLRAVMGWPQTSQP